MKTETAKTCQIKSPDVLHDCEQRPGHSGPCYCIVVLGDGTRTKYLWKQKAVGSWVWYVQALRLRNVQSQQEAVA